MLIACKSLLMGLFCRPPEQVISYSAGCHSAIAFISEVGKIDRDLDSENGHPFSAVLYAPACSLSQLELIPVTHRPVVTLVLCDMDKLSPLKDPMGTMRILRQNHFQTILIRLDPGMGALAADLLGRSFHCPH